MYSKRKRGTNRKIILYKNNNELDRMKFISMYLYVHTFSPAHEQANNMCEFKCLSSLVVCVYLTTLKTFNLIVESKTKIFYSRETAGKRKTV